MDMKNMTINKKSKRGSLSAKKREIMIFYYSMIALPILQFLIFYVYINFSSFTLGFQEYSHKTGDYYWVGFKNFVTIFQDFKRLDYLRNSVTNSLSLFVWTMIFCSMLAILFSYYIYKKSFGHSMFKVLLYLPHILGGIVVVIMYKFFVENGYPELMKTLFKMEVQGLLSDPETTRGAILFYTIFVSFGGQVLVYSSTMSGISDSIIESAELDGITPIKELVFIVLPSIWYTFVTFMVSLVVGIFTNQMNLFTFFDQYADFSLYTFGYYLFRGVKLAEYKDYPYLSAMGLLLTAIAVPLTLFVRWALTKFGPSKD